MEEFLRFEYLLRQHLSSIIRVSVISVLRGEVSGSLLIDLYKDSMMLYRS